MAAIPSNALYKFYLRTEVLEAVAHIGVHHQLQTACDELKKLVQQGGSAVDFDETALPSAVLGVLATHHPAWIAAKAAVLEESKGDQEFNVLHNVWVGLKRCMQDTIRLQQDPAADLTSAASSGTDGDTDDAAGS